MNEDLTLLQALRACARNYWALVRRRFPRAGAPVKPPPLVVDGWEFEAPLDAALHLLWLLQRLSYSEKHRAGQPCDGFRFRQGILAARELLRQLEYEPGEASRANENPADMNAPIANPYANGGSLERACYAALWAECSVCGQPISWMGNGSPQPNEINLQAILASGWTVTDAKIYCAGCKPRISSQPAAPRRP
jgi:hypothetical protein